ncbi:MAG: M61 family metallopeptidase [Gemmatirosa sp.]
MTTTRARVPALLPLLALTAAPLAGQGALQGAAPLRYTVDLGTPGGSHAVAVTLRVDSLAAGDSVFQFAATAPGTYQTMDIGRFVRDLRATDARGRPLAVTRLSTNQWRIASPRRVRAVRWRVLDTQHAPITEFPVYPMAGSAIEREHALLNWHAIIGFPATRQASPVALRLLRPRDWQVATALREEDGVFRADSFDHLVDSPVLTGRLTTARTCVTGVPVTVAVHSPKGQITAEQLKGAMHGTLEAAGKFLGTLPVDRYVFLFDFAPLGKDAARGAWEHSYSSAYTLDEVPFTDEVGREITGIAAHEFFHVVTPLNIHSELVERFDYQRPVPSRHLWLYEGVTEWAAQKMRQEGGLASLDEYLRMLAGKARTDRLHYDTTYSLTDLAHTSYTAEGARQYGNVYMRGALVAGLLDIRLLQLSDGRRGLRALVTELARDYGRSRPFAEDSLIPQVVARTHPAIADFFARHVERAEPLPLRESYALLGIDVATDERGIPTRFVPRTDATPAQLRLREAWLHGGDAPPAPAVRAGGC